MFRPSIWRSLKRLIFKGKLPPRHRRLEWDAEWRFNKVAKHLSPNDIAIDCGANVGKFTHLLGKTGAMVYAFEPDPYCFEILKSKFEGRPNIRLFNKAVGAENGKTALYRSKDFESDPTFFSQASSLYASKTNVDATQCITVDQVDLIEFIATLPRVSLLKIDIEGAEVPVIEKLLDTGMIDKVGHTFAETHERNIPELVARTAALRKRITAEKRSNLDLDWA